MGWKKAVAWLERLFDRSASRRAREVDALREVLKLLKRKERRLREDLAGESRDKRRRSLRKKLEIIRVQRRKGVRLCRDLRRR
ncbi:MAG: hypothetical protein H7831_02000 [Magnetococcus sp. WYHC-3]